MIARDKKDEIRKAAIECFARYGFEKTTMDDIGKLVGLNKASLYYYYKNKEAIYGDAIYAEADQAIQGFRSQLEGVHGCKKRFESYIQGRMQYIHLLFNLHQLSMDQFYRIQPTFETIYQEINKQEISLVNDMLLACLKAQEIKSCDTRRVAEHIVTVIDAIKLKACHGKDIRFAKDINYDAIAEDMIFTVGLILDGLMTGQDVQN